MRFVLDQGSWRDTKALAVNSLDKVYTRDRLLASDTHAFCLGLWPTASINVTCTQKL